MCVFRNYRQCPDQKGALTTDEVIESFLKDLEDPTKSSIKTSEYISRMPLDTRENPVKIKQTIINFLKESNEMFALDDNDLLKLAMNFKWNKQKM